MPDTSSSTARHGPQRGTSRKPEAKLPGLERRSAFDPARLRLLGALVQKRSSRLSIVLASRPDGCEAQGAGLALPNDIRCIPQVHVGVCADSGRPACYRMVCGYGLASRAPGRGSSWRRHRRSARGGRRSFCSRVQRITRRQTGPQGGRSFPIGLGLPACASRALARRYVALRVLFGCRILCVCGACSHTLIALTLSTGREPRRRASRCSQQRGSQPSPRSRLLGGTTSRTAVRSRTARRRRRAATVETPLLSSPGQSPRAPQCSRTRARFGRSRLVGDRCVGEPLLSAAMKALNR